MIRLSLALGLMVALPAAAHAHAMDFECKVRAGKLRLEAYFEDDTPAQQAIVRVLDADEKEVLRGKTDAKGVWSAEAPPPGVYNVIVDAGAGHRAERKMTIPGATSQAAPEAAKEQVSAGPGREEFTQFPWLKVALGVGTIAALALAFMIARRSAS